MTLHEAIETILKEHKRPLSAKAIASIINSQGFYQRNDGSPVDAKQISSRVKNYPSLFETINGQIVLIEDQIWKNILINVGYLNNILKGIYNSGDIQFILAVLLFYKRHYDIYEHEHRPYLFTKLNLHWNIEQTIDNAQLFINNLEKLEIYELGPRGIFIECARLLSYLDNYKKAEIFIIISHLDSSELDHKTFGDVFEYFLNISPSDKYNSALSPTPYSLRELMVSILDPKPGSSLLDPVAGTGGLLIESFHHSRYSNITLTGNEINMRIAQLGNMNLIMHGIHQVSIKTLDSFDETDNNATYDYVIADLPISGITTSHRHESLFHSFGLNPSKSGNGFGSFVLLALSKLNEYGKAVITVSENFLTKRGQEFEIRDLLLQHDIIESVVSLPHGTLRPYTEAKASLLVLNKNKEPSLRNKIRFITSKVADQDNRAVYLNNEDTLSAYKTDALLSKDAQILDISELRPDANLSVDGYDEQYFLANLMLKEGSGRLLSELVTIRAGIQPEKSDVDSTGDYPLVKIENLSHDILETNLANQVTSKVYLSPRYHRSVINEKCLLIARIGERVKATIFNPDEKRPRILIHSGVYALIPLDRKNSVDIEYLYYQFHSSFVLEQIKKRKLGAVMPYISIGSLKEIVIPYVDPVNQKSFIESQKANLISEEKHRVNTVLRALGSKDVIRQSETEIIKTLTHQLRPKFMEISSLAKRIKRVVNNEGLNKIMEYKKPCEDFDPELEEYTAKPENYPLENLIDKVLNDSEHLSNVLSIVDKVMNFKLSAEDLFETDLLHFLNEYKKSKDITVNHRYEILVKGENATAEINHAAVTDLLDQLLQNAEDHGFIENIVNKKYRIQFIVRAHKNRNVISIDYTNNGAPYELQEKDFVNAFEKGRNSKGSGIGGNYINRIIEAHGGQIRIVENNTKGFSLTIELPTNKNITYE